MHIHEPPKSLLLSYEINWTSLKGLLQAHTGPQHLFAAQCTNVHCAMALIAAVTCCKVRLQTAIWCTDPTQSANIQHLRFLLITGLERVWALQDIADITKRAGIRPLDSPVTVIVIKDPVSHHSK